MAQGAYMESQNNNSYVDPDLDSRRRKLVIIVGAILFVIILALLIIFTAKDSKKQDIPDIDKGGRYTDPYSGETISDPPDKAPEKYNANPDTPVFLGYTKLLDLGISSTQVNDYQYAIFQKYKTENKKVSEVSIDVKTINLQQHDRYSSSNVDTALFDIVVDRKDRFKVKMDYYDLTKIHLYMFDTTGKQLYDSGELDTMRILPEEVDSYTKQ